MRVIWTYIFLIISIPLFLISCEKENDTFPSISNLSVNQSGSYEFGDTIILRVSIKDLDGPVRIGILQGASLRPLPSELFSVRGNDYIYRIFINDKYYESGPYSLRVQAFNGENGVSNFRTIKIEGLKKGIRGICYLARVGNTNILYKIDSLGVRTQTSIVNDLHKKVVCDSREAQILVLPQSTGSLKGLKYKNLAQKFELDISPATLEFENLFHDNGDTYIFLKDGRVLTVNTEGQAFLEFSLPDNFIAKKMTFTNDQILIGAQQQGSNLNELFLLQRSNNSISQRVFISGELADLKAAGNGMYFMIYPKNNNTIVAQFNSNTGLVTEKYSVNNEIPNSLELAENIFYLATDQGIYTFPQTVFQFPQNLFTFGGEDLLFDDVNKEIYVVSGNNIWKTPLGSSQNQFVASGADPILGLDIIYNK